jgi:hypothetical protein
LTLIRTVEIGFRFRRIAYIAAASLNFETVISCIGSSNDTR